MKITEESLRAKEREFESIRSRMLDLEKVNAGLAINSDIQADSVSMSVNQQESFGKRIESLQKEIDLLNQDKTYLTRESEVLKDRSKTLEHKLDLSNEEALDAKKRAESYLERLLNQKDEQRFNVNDRHIKEIDNLREKHEKDINL